MQWPCPFPFLLWPASVMPGRSQRLRLQCHLPWRGDALIKFLRPPADCHQVRSQWNRTRTISLTESLPVKGLRISACKPTQRSCVIGDVLILWIDVPWRCRFFEAYEIQLAFQIFKLVSFAVRKADNPCSCSESVRMGKASQ